MAHSPANDQPPATHPEAPTPGDFVQIGAAQTLALGDMEAAREQFQRFHAIAVRNILEPAFLATLLRACDATPFGVGLAADGEPEKTPGFREVELSPQRVGRIVNVALARPVFLRWLEEATGCEPLGTIEGRLTQTLHRPGDELLWHDDIPDGEGRRLAMVINLGTKPFEGGEFAIRPKGGATLFEHRYTEPGSALIFEVHPTLEHRVRPLTAGGPRRVFAGWAFRA